MTPSPKKSPLGQDPLDALRSSGRRRLAAASAPAPEPGTTRAADPQAEATAILADVAVALASVPDLTGILNKIVDGIIRVTGCERGFLMLRESDGEFSTFAGRYANMREWGEKDARAISLSVRNRVVDTHEVFTSSDLSQLDEFRSNASIQSAGITAAVCVPLLYKESLIGVIYADSTHLLPRPLEDSRAVLRAFGVQGAFAVESARSRGELLARRDGDRERTAEPARRFRMGGMVSRDRAMERVFSTVEKIAPSSLTVLIQGESGTGKDLLAQAIHENSPRAKKPFITVNSGGMNDELVSSILFGHKKGSFTGAVTDRQGVFDLAEGGTLFLDEIGEMPPATQPKLLRALENREISRLGEEGVVKRVDVRIIAATNCDLAAAVAGGSFREDLFSRLRVALVHVPPLRERRDDIIPLALHFISRYAEEHAMPAPELSREARGRLMAETWEGGNVRALKNAIEVSIAFRDDRNVIHAAAIDRYFEGSAERPRPVSAARTLREEMDRHEEAFVRRVLADNGYNVSKAAAVLGISRQQLHAKIRKYGIVTRGA